MSRYSLTLVTGPTDEPVTVPSLKSNSRVTGTSQDLDFAEWGKAAREMFEAEADVKLMPQTWLLTIDRFPDNGPIEVPIYPFAGVTHIKYDDVDDAEQTLSSALYYADLKACPGLIYPVPETPWPQTSLRMRAVRVTVTAGFASAELVPARAKQAIKMLVSHWNQNRELATDRNTKGVEVAWDRAVQAMKPGMF